MPAQTKTAPDRTSPRRIADARRKQLETVLGGIERSYPPLLVDAESYAGHCRAELNRVVASALRTWTTTDSVSRVTLHSGQGVTETLTVLHGVAVEGAVHAVLYAVRVEGCLTYERLVTDQQDPLFRLAVEFTAHAL